ncbi:hypothetical protein [Bordetella genomosp. 11]|uniref:Uncharacterized protein n=1 Tax=Bordetella genomosp. 11 TaxID=1416808 RepID=A0A261UES6_9BORD|nr:hypothetical protein [Bordetella genomosp. 11]OZI59932.1 hypothetical protein CAL28_10620 [Bordetella genomosp. 11]
MLKVVFVPSPCVLQTTGERIAEGASIPPDDLAALLKAAANQWQADQGKIAYLESLLLRK